MDLGAGLSILGTAIGSKDLLQKILGPTAEYLGEQLRDWTKKRTENMGEIFKNAEKKLGNKIDENGIVAPKILKGIIDNGTWCEERLQLEYFGGILASSRTDKSRDDRGAYFINLIARLSTYQLRIHFLFYKSLINHCKGEKVNFDDWEARCKLRLHIPMNTLIDAMNFSDNELKNMSNIIRNAIWGLSNENLIGNFSYGEAAFYVVESTEKEVLKEGFIFEPTIVGIELIMWAYGYGQTDISEIFSIHTIFDDVNDIKIGYTKKIE